MGAPKELTLKVAEAIQDDVNKGIVRIDSAIMQEIDVRPGDIVEIGAERKTVAIVDRAYPSDLGLSLIRMDGIIRRNAKTGIGEAVKVKKAEVKEAKKVTISPARKGIHIKAPANLFKQGLLGRAVVKGDIVSLGGTRRRKTAMSESPFFEDVFNMLDESLMGFGFGDIKFLVVDAQPKQAVIITEATEVEFNPEAVEVKDEEMPDISYEDIGGLEEEIKKIREMVELPLKHPEIFERLGIEPPKGVLLHGPPGTGKTLLAKAVANETNSNFILINGPEIMSKYYGQSLPADEQLLVSENGMFKRVPIGDIVEQNRIALQAVCFDSEGKIAVRPITALIKHKRKGKIMEVRTRSGRSIRVTDDHSLFTLGAHGLVDVKTSALVPGKSFVAVPKKLPFSPNPIEEIDLLEALRHTDHGIYVGNGQQYLIESIAKLGISAVANILDVREKYVYDIKSKNVGIPVSSFLRLMETAGITPNCELLQIRTKGKSMPALLKFSEDLWTFFGLWMAEGSYTTKNEVRLSIHRREEELFAQLCRKLFGQVLLYHKPNSLGMDIFICSGILGKIMQHVLGFTPGSREKHIPDLLYNLRREHVAAFLRGYISGDGGLNTKTPAPMVEIATESPALADGVAYLLLQFGIVTKIYRRSNRPQRRLCFADYDNLEQFREIGFLDSVRNQTIYQYLSQRQFSRRDQVPIVGEIRELVATLPQLSAWRNSQTIGKNVLQQLELPLPKYLIASDIYWDRVVEVRETGEEPEFVYDIAVPPTENFVAGFGGIFAHNSEENLRKKFEDAEKNAPSIIFIDEIDAIASKREEAHGEVERRVVAQLLALMDGLKSRGKVVVIAASNLPNQLDIALRRPGRFDREIEIAPPNKEGRLNVLKIHTRNMPLSKTVNLKEIAAITHGFVGADLSALAKEAAMIVLRRVFPDLRLNQEEAVPKEVLEKLYITQKDFKESLKVVRPSALREVLVEVPTVKWEDIGGLAEVKQELKEAVEWPLKHPEAFKRLGVSPPKGVLMYGAPGTGKTLLAKAVANESEANFISVKGPELFSKWVGESEKAVREIFRKARQCSPTIIFFDEVDAMAPRRGMSENHVTERVVNQLLTEIDGLEDLHDVVVIASTNRPDIIDASLLRPGRFDRIVLVKAPDAKSRLDIFKVHSKDMPLAKDVDLKQLAECTEGYAGADIEGICKEAAIFALREDIKAKEVKLKHFEDALKKVRPSITPEVEKVYEDLLQHFRAAKAKEIMQKPTYFG